jgi:hypothetical protein
MRPRPHATARACCVQGTARTTAECMRAYWWQPCLPRTTGTRATAHSCCYATLWQWLVMCARCRSPDLEVTAEVPPDHTCVQHRVCEWCSNLHTRVVHPCTQPTSPTLPPPPSTKPAKPQQHTGANAHSYSCNADESGICPCCALLLLLLQDHCGEMVTWTICVRATDTPQPLPTTPVLVHNMQQSN